ncbi:MAG: hypothetical protein ABFS05_03725, partial [Bacteroidota bacterium]
MKYRILFSAILFMLGMSGIVAQNKNGEVHMPDAFDYPSINITSVEVSGNKLTQDDVIIRELDFKIGDSLSVFQKGRLTGTGIRRFFAEDSSEVKLRMGYSRDNIINTKLFLTADIYLEQLQGND